jgi:hypothetical protein
MRQDLTLDLPRSVSITGNKLYLIFTRVFVGHRLEIDIRPSVFGLLGIIRSETIQEGL